MHTTHADSKQPKYSKNPKTMSSKSGNAFNSEFNKELGMTIYYTPTALPHFTPTHSTTLEDTQDNYIRNFIIKIVETQLWQYPAALDEFRVYINKIIDGFDLGNEPFESIWINDISFYKPIHTKYMEISNKYNIQTKLGENTHGGADRGNNRVKSIEKYVIRRQPINCKISPTCYLDIGCFDGGITHAISNYFNLHKLQTHGVDIKSYSEADGYSNITFSQYDGKTLPYSDNSFDLITCLMVLHHVPEENLKTLMSEINRVMKPNGFIILREHDVNKDNERSMLDVMHHFYDYVWSADHWSDTSKQKSDGVRWKTNYKSNIEISEMFMSNGFVPHTNASIFNNAKLNPFMSYMCSYRKHQNINSGNGSEMYRLLSDDLPRDVYKRRTKEVKNVIHWGQRKLLLTEIEFFTMFLRDNPDIETPVYAIYAGASPGTHILYLSKLFPTIHFELYDPREFSNKLLKNTNMIKTHVQYFTDDTAKQWVSSDHPDKTILLISDIRTGTPEIQTPETVEERVKIDHDWQQSWYHIIKPERSMFKFRLPWDDKKTEYLDGDIYIQPYPPPTSTETRLIIGKDAGVKIYNNRKYEEQLFHFNNQTRCMNFNNILYDIHSTHKNGLSNDYDSASEVHILEQYLNLNGFKSNGRCVIIKNKISNMVGDISRELSYSRTLYSHQPIKDRKKIMMLKLQQLGYIPDNIELNQSVFNIYVIPRYDFFESNGLLG